MTTYIHFTPQPLQAFGFAATLDGQEITCQVPWSLFANRWYLSMADANGISIVFRALIGSPDALVIKNIEWDQDDGIFVETLQPHMFEFMQTCNLTIAGADPDVLNGIWSCFILSPTTFVIPYPEKSPVPIQSYGQVSCDVNLAAGYFNTSTLVFRQSTQQFEITP
jgi:hypothetical protein